MQGKGWRRDAREVKTHNRERDEKGEKGDAWKRAAKRMVGIE